MRQSVDARDLGGQLGRRDLVVEVALGAVEDERVAVRLGDAGGREIDQPAVLHQDVDRILPRVAVEVAEREHVGIALGRLQVADVAQQRRRLAHAVAVEGALPRVGVVARARAALGLEVVGDDGEGLRPRAEGLRQRRAGVGERRVVQAPGAPMRATFAGW